MSGPGRPPEQSAHLVAIDADQAGQRIDNFLIRQLKGVPKSRIYRILRRGEVRVNKGRIDAGYRLRDGDTVRIPPLRQGPKQGVVGGPGSRARAQIANSILYEDSALLILNKPTGIAVHGGSGLSYGVIETLRALRPEARFLELVHRLDRETSGCLMVAKKRSMLRHLHSMIRANRVVKRYVALLCGRWSGRMRLVNAPLRRNVAQGGERVVRIDPEGKASATRFKPIERYAEMTLAEAELLSGRTHQIRVHAAHIGHPVAGDSKYGDPLCNRVLRELGLRRLFLHASSVSLRLPDQDADLQVTAPLDSALSAVLERLR